MNRKILIFIIIEAVLYLTFLSMDFMGKMNSLSNLLKVTCIVFCFLFVLSGYILNKSQDKLIITLALFFTVSADICLVFFEYEILGLIFFNMVQILYFYRLLNTGGRREHSIRFILFLLLETTLFIQKISINPLLLLASFYMVNVTCNTIKSVVKLKKNGEKSVGDVLFATGMILFLLCDLNVGVFNSYKLFDFHGRLFQLLFQFSAVGMWLFYLPSQVLISMSCVVFRVTVE